MNKANTSGISLTTNEAKIVLGMVSRGDRKHDISAWFGVNQGRIKDVEDGKYGTLQLAPENELPPKGPPGLKGRRLRQAVQKILVAIESSENEAVKEFYRPLLEASKKYDSNES